MMGEHLQEAVPDGAAAVRYQPYPEYKESGVEWIGDVPKHWKQMRLKELSLLVGRIGFRGYSTEDLVPEGDGAISMSPSNMIDGCVDLSKCTWLSWQKYYESPEIQIEGNDVVMVKTGSTIGKVVFVDIVNTPMTINPQLMIFKNISCNKKHLFYYLSSKAIQDILPLHNTGSTIPTMTQEGIGKLYIPIPPPEEQQTIAAFLDYKTAKIDALIAKKKALLENLAEKRTALISHAVTKGLDPKTPMRDSGIDWLGEIPAHWEVKRLKFVVSTFGGGTPNTGKHEYWNGDIPWVSPKDMKSDLIGSTEDYLTELGVQESATKIVSSNSVLIVVRSGILRHTIPVARNTTEVALNQDMKALITKVLLLPGYLHCLINGLQKGLLPLWSKPGCTVESIEMGYMLNTEIPIPPVFEQDQIISHVEGLLGVVDIQTARVTEIITRLQEYRSALITNVVTGKIDVRSFRFPEDHITGEADAQRN